MQHNDTSSNNLFTNIERLGTRDLLSYGQFSYDIILTSIQNNNTLPLSINPSRALVKGLARATNGYFNFIAPHTNVDIYVAEQLARALQPSIADVYVKWNTSQRILYKVPEHAPPVFVGDRLLFYALLDETMPFDHTTTVELFTGMQQQPIGLARIDHVPSVLGSQFVMRLVAKALLRELSNDQKTIDKELLINISIKYGILCPYTAFIGVERRLNTNNESNIDMKLREVPIMIKNAAIYGFVARIDDEREIVAEIKEKKAAQQEYTQALAQGHGAFLLEQDEVSNDIFTISVGARDIIIDVELSDVRRNTIAAIDNGAVMISFIPTEQDCRQESNNMMNEFFFVIDCSGSMAGDDKIGLARKAMLLFLKSLPVNCRFNIIRFGSKFSALFTDQVTREYNKENMCQAEAMIKDMGADLGGTELLMPLRWLKENKPPASCVRQIFLLTDGEVSNVSEVTNLCRDMAAYTRIFSFGLGHSPSRALVKGLARATNGYFNFIAPHTNVDIYVAEQLARALQPSIADVYVKWNTNQRILYKVPEHAPPVFVGDRLLFYALLDETMPFDHTTTVELFVGMQQQPIGLARIDHVPSVLGSQFVMRLAAKALLRELWNDQKTIDKELLVNISIKYGILCPYTAFIGVERRFNTNNERICPVAMTCWGQQVIASMVYNTEKLNTSDSKPVTHSTRDDINQSVHNSSSSNSQTSKMIWPIDEQKLVDRFIELQQYNGLWMLTADDVHQLTGKSLAIFSSSVIEKLEKNIQQSVITTAIVIILLETRCLALKTLWQALSNKAYKSLKDLLDGDESKVEQLMKDIRHQCL
ncbi:unnamed protein product [Rotaria sp. Silwood1]|nr:unnamed protein product [Rotaria sp. Silwood1]